MIKTGIGLLQNTPLPETVRLTKRVEELGYDSVWYAEHNFSRDGVTACAAAAAVTERITIGPSVCPIFTRSPLLMATTFAALDELSEGRFVAGIGAGSRVLIKAQGINFVKPLKALREYVEACRKVWNAHGTHFDYHGEMVHLENAELDFEPVRRDLPVWLGPTGPLACQLTGEIAEGASLNAFLGTEYVTWALDHLQKGAERAGRTVDDLEVGMMLVACCRRLQGGRPRLPASPFGPLPGSPSRHHQADLGVGPRRCGMEAVGGRGGRGRRRGRPEVHHRRGH